MSVKSSDKKRPGSVDEIATGGAITNSRLRERAGEERPTSDKSERDVAIVCGVSADGRGIDIIRKRGERIEAGTVRRLEQGKPIHGEVIRLRPREQHPMICDVEVEVPAPTQLDAQPTTSGPAQVATEEYRRNWDAIYGRNKKPNPLLN